jgi:predicted house-cleaning NTP pyrophosphatase (Maf/HAM1 superfamily)
LRELTARGLAASGTWEGCSGAYAIQELDDPHARVLEGSVGKVIGLPMETLERVLPKLLGA